MRFIKLSCLLLAGVSGFAASSYAEDSVEEVGEWKVISRPQPDGQQLCTLQSPANADGIYFFLANPRGVDEASKGIGFLSIVYPTRLIDSESDTIADVVFSVSKKARWEISETTWQARNPGGVLSASLAQEIVALLEPFARGKSLQVDAERLTTEIPLGGSYGAVLAYKDCIGVTE